VLFDLQSPGRRRVVRITFGALAAVFAISFVFLGVGTGGGGFSFSDLFGGGGGDTSGAFDDDIKAQEQKLAVNPNDTAALAQLVQLHYSAGNADVDGDGNLTSDGEQQLRESADAWTKYLKLSQGTVAQGPPLYALQTFDRLGSTDFQAARTSSSATDALDRINAAIADWKGAAEAQQILNEKKPSASGYGRLASYLYLSGQAQAAEQAVAQAKGSSKGGEASQLDQQLKPIKQLGVQLQSAIDQLTKSQQQQQGATGGGTNPLGGISGGGLSGTGGLSGQ
jgi:hypothetical protein